MIDYATMDAKTYNRLYARYLRSDPRLLLLEAKLKKGEKVMDLCGGNGRASLAALKMGAREVIYVDTSLHLFKTKGRTRINPHFLDVKSALSFSWPWVVDVMICQQAANYWLDQHTVSLIPRNLKNGGRFVFNTFRKKPNPIPRTKEYSIGNHHYVETSWRIGKVVHHLQVCSGLEPHYTTFKWISPTEFKRFLRPHFSKVDVLAYGPNTDIYVCWI